MTQILRVKSVTFSSEQGIALLSLFGVGIHILLRYGTEIGTQNYRLALAASFGKALESPVSIAFDTAFPLARLPLVAVVFLGGLPLLWRILQKIREGDWGADSLAAISIVVAAWLDEWLAGSLVVLMLSGGAVLESYALRKASSVLEALAKRVPSIAHLKTNEKIDDIAVENIQVGDNLLVFPHEICPVDGTVVAGTGAMDESYLTGEPYVMAKTVGSKVLSGAINGEAALTVRADKLPADSRYAKIMEVMRISENYRPKIRRLGDQLGAIYAPLSLFVAGAIWYFSGDVVRFLSVLVVATPCPLLIGIPVTIISSISLAAEREIIIKNPSVLETLGSCRTAIFDKTGTLTYGRPSLTQIISPNETDKPEILTLAASLERYSKHPLSSAIVKAGEAAEVVFSPVAQIAEMPGQGISGLVSGRHVAIIHRQAVAQHYPTQIEALPPPQGGLECVVLIDGRFAAVMQFRDEVRTDSSSFISHLQPNHLFDKVMLVSGDRESEVRYLAELVGIEHVYFSQSPEQKLALVRKETQATKTVFLGDGINDAPALTAATIGIAFGQNSDITGEAADAVIMDSSLLKVDELFHIGERMRRIALQSAIGGMVLSATGMAAAGAGYLNPVSGALAQELIDVLATLNALRAALPPKSLSDY